MYSRRSRRAMHKMSIHLLHRLTKPGWQPSHSRLNTAVPSVAGSSQPFACCGAVSSQTVGPAVLGASARSLPHAFLWCILLGC